MLLLSAEEQSLHQSRSSPAGVRLPLEAGVQVVEEEVGARLALGPVPTQGLRTLSVLLRLLVSYPDSCCLSVITFFWWE